MHGITDRLLRIGSYGDRKLDGVTIPLQKFASVGGNISVSWTHLKSVLPLHPSSQQDLQPLPE